MIPTLDVRPVLTDKELKAQSSRFLTLAQCLPIDRSMRITCEGKLKALFLKAEDYKPISNISYQAALRSLELIKEFNPAYHSRRRAINQNLGGDLLLGWIKSLTPDREDIFRAGHRDHFVAAFWLVPLLKDCEQALAQHLPEYWPFHQAQARRLVRPKREKLKTLDKVPHLIERKSLEDWDKTNRLYLFPGSEAFSTVTLNQNIRFLPHQDKRNVPETLSCLTALGSFGGGALGFPRLGVSFNIQPGDLLIADANTEFHGTVGGIFGNRYSMVAYLHKSLLPKKS